MGLPSDRSEWAVLWPELLYLLGVIGLCVAIGLTVLLLVG